MSGVLFRRVAICIAAASVMACGEPVKSGVTGSSQEGPEKNPEIASVEVNSISPDSTVKSWWRVLDLREKLLHERCLEQQKRPAEEKYIHYMEKSAQGDVLATFKKQHACQAETYNRDIQEVKTESETRAIVFAVIKNTTPIPAGAQPSGDAVEEREAGFRFKYVLEKSSDGWKISQVYSYEELNATLLGKEPWEERYDYHDRVMYPSAVWYP